MPSKKNRKHKVEPDQTSIYEIFCIDISNGKKKLRDKLDDRIELLWKNDAISEGTKKSMKRTLSEELR